MSWIDKKAYDLAPQSWMIQYLKMYIISKQSLKYIRETKEISRGILTAEGKSLVEVEIQCDIFQGDALSPL